jgi:uncharacterized damage-inducible protein DinB
MNVADIQSLYRYNDWANRRLLDAASALPAESVSRDLGGSLASVRDVVAHVVSTEWAWLERWHGTNPSSVPDWVDGNVVSLIARLGEVQTKRAAFLKTISNSDLSSPVSFVFMSGVPDKHELQDLLVHVVNHSTYHRGQLASMLRRFGTAPPATDFVVFKAEMRQQK